MQMPTMEQVEMADRLQLARWYRFLPGPGTSALDKPPKEFHKTVKVESEIIQRIVDRHSELGGWTPTLSKLIGWDP